MSADSPIATPVPPVQSGDQSSAVTRGTLDLLVGHENPPATNQMIHHHHHHHHRQQGNHKKKRSSQGSEHEDA